MKAVNFDVRAPAEAMAEFASAWKVGKARKAAHGDVTALLNAGVLERTDDGLVVFPYETVKVEFLLQAA